MVPIVAYEELPEGIKVMIREEGGHEVVVIDSRLSRVERAKARELGKAMLRERHQHVFLHLGILGEWGQQRLRDLAPVCRGSATAVAGGALAMTMVVGSDIVVDKRIVPPSYAESPTIAADRMSEPRRFAPMERIGDHPDPAAVGRVPVRPANAAPPMMLVPPARPSQERETTPPRRPEQDQIQEAVPERAGRQHTTSYATPAPDVTKASQRPAADAADVQGPSTKSSTASPPASSPPPKDTPTPEKTSTPEKTHAPDVKLPGVEVDLPDLTPSSLGDTVKEVEETVKDTVKNPVGVGSECDGLVNVDVKLLPKVCVGG
ncbi:hypothetical protein ACNF49_13905 [Actinomadura sp. ATCC 39365]